MSSTPVSHRAVRLATAFVRRVFVGRVPRLFDADFYLRMNRDVARYGIDPFLHYAWRGAAQGRNPAEDFDTRFYLEQSGPTRLDPIRHYLRVGARAGHDPNPGFNSLWYLSHHRDVAGMGTNPLLHYRTNGRREGRTTCRSAFGSAQLRILEGVSTREILRLPSCTRAAFEIRLERAIPISECPDPAQRFCVFLTLSDAEIEGLLDAFAIFPTAAFDALTLRIDRRTPAHPQRATLLAAFEHCYAGGDRSGSVRWMRYAEARLWDLRPSEPRVAVIAPPGSIRFGPA